jgi:hypothetical protein
VVENLGIIKNFKRLVENVEECKSIEKFKKFKESLNINSQMLEAQKKQKLMMR